jgi:hypothetical protein
VIAAGATIAGIGLVVYAARQSLALNAGQLQDPAMVQTIRDFATGLEAFTPLPLTALALLTSWVLLNGGGANRRIGQVGFVVSTVLLLGAFGAGGGPLRTLGPVGFLAAVLWLAALAVHMIVCARRGRDPDVVR